jgi:predicted Zn-dependent protease
MTREVGYTKTLFAGMLRPMNSLPENAAPTGRAASDVAADASFARAVDALRTRRPLRNPRLREARRALHANRPDIAGRLLTEFLKDRPGDVDAMNLLGETAMREERKSDAEALFMRCIQESPGFDAARFNYATALQGMNRPADALGQVRKLLAKEPRNPLYRDLEAVVLSAMGSHEAALDRRRELARDYPGSAKVLVSYAHTLRTMGLREQCIAAYREAIAINPSLGTAWWGIANLRTGSFTASDIAQLQAQVARKDLSASDRTHLLFALGKAYGDLSRYAESFDAYARANAARRLTSGYDPATTSAQVARFKAHFAADFFRNRTGSGSPSAEAIFVVGMQRSGSTLLEQILASHSAIEGAGELAHLRFLARNLEDRVAPQYRTDYPGVLGKLDAAELRALGDEYLQGTRIRRPLGRPFFVDKDPFNFWHTGFLQLILPNARIIDIRRHPLGCCWSNFTTIYLHGLPLTYRLADVGRFYADYVDLMTHFDRVLPGKVHRIFYEDLVADPEAEIRRLFAYLDLPFEQACLEFYRNSRAVNSASSEQVRTPIFHEALDRWRYYEPWLGPLKSALGPVLSAYPAVPA